MRVTVKMKLALAFATVIILSGITAWLGISNVAALNATMEDLLAGPVERLQLAQDMSTDDLVASRAIDSLVLEGGNAEARIRHDADFAKAREIIIAQFAKIEANATAEDKKRIAGLDATRLQWAASNDRIRELVRDNQLAEATALAIDPGQRFVDDVEKQIEGYIDVQRSAVEEAKTSVAQQFARTRLLLIAAASIGLLIAVGAAAWIACRSAAGWRARSASPTLSPSAISTRRSPCHQQRRDQGSGGRAQPDDRQPARYGGVADQFADGDLTIDAKRCPTRTPSA